MRRTLAACAPEEQVAGSRDPATSPPAPPSRVPEVFGPGGLLARAFPGYEPRPQQAAMAAAVERATDRGEHLLFEAPCGVGKSVAYLGPAILRAVPRGRRVLVVTANIALQEQLVGKDLPGLRAILPVPFTFAIAKGRAQWLCEEQFAETRAEVARKGKLKVLGAANAHRWEELEAWAMRTQTGDLSELTSFDVGAVRQYVAVSADECAGPSCPSRKECHAERAKAEFWKADVVVTNYAMFLLDLALRIRSEGESGALPAWDVLVLDEAHACADIARDHFGARATEGAVKHAARLLDRGDDAVAPDLADDLRAEAESYFRELLDYRRSKEYLVRFKRPAEGPDSAPLCVLLTAGAVALARAASAEENGARRQRMRSGARRMLEVGQLLRDAFALAEPERIVYFAEVEGSKGHERAALASRLIYPADFLREHLFAKEGRSVVMCSATLATGDVEDPRSFEFIRSELGCDTPRTRALGVSSPFDLARQALLCAPRIGAGAKDRDDHEAACARAIVALAHATRGRLLAVFTSRRGLSRAREAFDEVPSADCTWTELLVQGDAPRTELVRRFKAALRPAELCPACGTDVGSRAFCDCPARPPTRWPMHGAVLLGLDSFREGVDVPGEALSVVVLDRLPFATPDDPVLDAVDQATPGGAFMTWMLPRAITGFRQLVGRGVRRLDDRAAVVVLDDRLVSKGYGRKFIRAVAPIPLTRELEDAARFVGGDVGEGIGR